MKQEKYLVQIGKRIKAKREAKGLTMRSFCELAGMDLSSYSRIENGQKNSHIMTLKKIAEILKADVKEFI